jgi:diaminopimelate epimerase
MIAFSKYEGAGNDFILIDDRTLSFPIKDKELVRRLCHRQKGIGADGLLLLQPSLKADFRMHIFNSDGSEPAMCGNGLRCFLHFIHALGCIQPSYKIETDAGLYEGKVAKERVALLMGIPHIMHWKLQLSLAREKRELYVLNTGVPHAVIFVPDVNAIDVECEGREIRHHPLFKPEGVNVDFASLISEETIAVRTYERGVENETLACGTGAAAVGFVASEHFHLKHGVTIVTRSLDRLKIDQVRETREIRMEGPATFVFSGSLSI